ncbi:hypothetical protein T08_5229 [Trichinella sp. T8]|nr:hypothetical protein T08_5229 [Trichinella sp. T8]
MGGVGLLDRQIGAYRPTIRGKNGISLCSFINALKSAATSSPCFLQVAAVRSKCTTDSSTLSQLPELLDIRFDGNHRGVVNCRSMCKADEARRTCQENTMFVSSSCKAGQAVLRNLPYIQIKSPINPYMSTFMSLYITKIYVP